ncbi:MAG: rod shape-determining protein MreC [Oscillospiraceae bacterium]|jgi:rod shape-determining protein MreC|nr:rod shape-determining protein MreC [Oscillospiraceae bacterium]
MRTFLTKRNIIILIVAIVIVAFAVVSLNTDGGPGIFTRALEGLSSPLKRAAGSVARTFESIFGYMYEYEDLVRENEELKREIQNYKLDYSDSTELAAENDRFRALFGFSARHADFRYADTAIIAWGASNWASSFTINKGYANSTEVAPIKVGDAVITETGTLIGRVTSVGRVDSTCVSVVDTTFSAAVKIGQLGATGLARGDFALMGDGKLRLSNIVGESAVVAGDSVFTSGMGGVYPEGLLIGTVIGVYSEESGIGVYAIVQPAAELLRATYAFVITDFYPAP